MSKLSNPGWIVIHSVAPVTKGNKPYVGDPSAASIRAYHVAEKGWADIGYHWVVRLDGRVEIGRAEDQVGAHVEGFNSKSIGVVFCGHGDLQDFTPAQKKAGVKLVVDILQRKKLIEAFLKNPTRVLGHRETAQLVPSAFDGPKTTKTCPGTKVDMTEFRNLCIAEAMKRRSA